MTRQAKVTKTLRTEGGARSPYRSKLDRGRDSRRRDIRWFQPSEDDRRTGLPAAHTRVWPLVERLQQKQAARQQMALHLACLYDDVEFTGLGSSSYEPAVFEASHLSFNVVRQCVDTLTAMVCKERPLPMPLTSGGDFKQQRRAREYGRWLEGTFEDAGVWRLDHVIGRDAALWGTGITHNWRHKDTLRHERAFPWEILVDPREAMHGKPQSFHYRRFVDRLKLIELFPKFEEAIDGADNHGVGADVDIGYDDTSDQVMVVTSWHPPSEKEAKDGRTSICLSNATLAFDDYDRAYPPLTALRMMNPLIGWFSTGLGQLLTGLQFTINDMCIKEQEVKSLAGNFILTDDASDVVAEHFDNDPWTIIRHAPGHPPQFVPVQPGSPDSFAFIQQLIPWANAVTGVSQQASQAVKPSGVTAARALEHLADEQTGRFAIFSKNFDQYHLDIAQQFTDLAEDGQDDGYNIATKVASRIARGGRRALRELDFKEVRLDREAYVLQTWPTSMLPKTPAGRLEIIDDMQAKGFIDKAEARMLLDFPDLEKSGNLTQSSYNAITDALEKIQDTGKYISPDPMAPFDMSIALGLQAYLDAKVDGAPPATLKLLRKWVTDARRLKVKATPPPPPPPPPPPGPSGPPMMPPGGPMPPAPMGAPPMMPPPGAA